MEDLLLRDVVRALDELYPPSSAAEWDRVGLVTGDLDQPVRRVLLAVDPTLAVIEEAADWHADLLVTHHPLLLRGVHSVATTSAKGAAVTRLVVSDTALFVAHTNADVADPGVTTVLADALGLTGARALSATGGYAVGCVGDLPAAESLAAFADRVADALPDTAGGIRVSGEPGALVRTVAVLGGAGDDRFDAVRASGADVYVTADLRHHPALEAREEARGGRPYLVDAGHWATESLWPHSARERLLSALGEDAAAPTRVEARVSTIRTEPWTFVVGANAAGGAS
ncbi:MAG TPA: Nif3-like dinuclear metal center hexameric protein [Intrasporangium sp.]|uniref:Nif3-like dinuclear metal center hexameric protein n=1 Tax=Intrasporangium sp. TaxID=1925024 RepID=UPI002D76B8FE|nr:Nif3-like dinuclear metal center hexameric protein [Intrasporangium sp.]HET7398691.1 Nif3-like dinuclear metal center hexameric protein [Intrasporangium sp.]